MENIKQYIIYNSYYFLIYDNKIPYALLILFLHYLKCIYILKLSKLFIIFTISENIFSLIRGIVDLLFSTKPPIQTGNTKFCWTTVQEKSRKYSVQRNSDLNNSS